MNFIKNKNKLFASVLFITMFVFLSFAVVMPMVSLAVEPDIPTINNPIPNITSINGFVKALLEGIIKIGIPIVAIAIIYSGFLFVTAQGKEAKITEAKQALIYTLAGAAILLGSWALAQLISETVIKLS